VRTRDQRGHASIHAISGLVVRSTKTVANEMDGFFRQARRRPAAVWGIRQEAATTHGGKIRRLMSLFWWNGLLGITRGGDALPGRSGNHNHAANVPVAGKLIQAAGQIAASTGEPLQSSALFPTALGRCRFKHRHEATNGHVPGHHECPTNHQSAVMAY